MRAFLFLLALLWMWACGVNSALHHWQDAVGELFAAALTLAVWRYWAEIRALFPRRGV